MSKDISTNIEVGDSKVIIGDADKEQVGNKYFIQLDIRAIAEAFIMVVNFLKDLFNK